MKFKKTETKKRDTYVYSFINVNGEIEHICLEVGKDGISKADVKLLHSMDDAEVYNNIKNSRPVVEEWQKKYLLEWQQKHPYESAPKNWNISINEIVGNEENAEREEFLEDKNFSYIEETDVICRLHEIVDSFTDIQKKTYRKVFLEEMSNISVAREDRKSEAAVRKTVKRIKEIIASDEKLKKFFK